MAKAKEKEVAVAPYRKQIVHEHDAARIRSWLDISEDDELPQEVLDRYFPAQQAYHQKFPGALPAETLRQVVKEATGFVVVLPRERPLPADAADNLSKHG